MEENQRWTLDRFMYGSQELATGTVSPRHCVRNSPTGSGGGPSLVPAAPAHGPALEPDGGWKGPAPPPHHHPALMGHGPPTMPPHHGPPHPMAGPPHTMPDGRPLEHG